MYRRTIVSTVLVALALLLAPTAAPPALAAGDAGAKQVIYKTLDGHIHELSVTVGGSWQHADLTQLTGAPIPATGFYPFGYAWEPNLLPNSSFELDANSDTQPDNWSSDSHFARSSTTKHSGSFAGRHFATDDSSYTISSQTINNLRPGEAYNIAGWVKIPPTSDSFSFEIRVRWFWGNFPMATDTIHTYLDDTGGAWELVSANKVAPAGTTSAQVQMVVSNLNSSIYVDDFVFGP